MKQTDKVKASEGELGKARGELDGEDMVAKPNVRRKKAIPEGYARADSLDKQKLRKYIKAVAKEAELYRNARKE